MEPPAEQPPLPPPLPVPQVRRQDRVIGFFITLLVFLFVGFPLQPFRPPPQQPQLFVSFCGNELRNGFVSHVVKALRVAGVNVFIDSDELKGRDLQSLFDRIDNSKMALVIFSDRFSESHWCLNQLARIEKRVKKGRLIAIPVFYKVSMDDVKSLKGKFGECFVKTIYEQSSQKEPLVDLWMTSVQSIASKTGFTSEVHRIDSDLVDAIIESVKRQLPHLSPEKKELPTAKELFYAFKELLNSQLLVFLNKLLEFV